METARLHTRLRRLVDTRRALAKASKEKERLGNMRRRLEAEVGDILRDEMKVKSYPVDLGEGYGWYRFTPNSTRYARVIDREQAIAALEERGHSRETLVTMKVREQQANELVNELLDHGQELPPGLDWYEREYVTMTKLNK